MDQLDAELEQPHAKMREALSGPIAPRVAVVDIHCIRQPVASERPLQSAANRGVLLIGAGRQANRVARMVVYHRQRMAGDPVGEPHPALEVHLPQLVRRFLLEPPVSARRALRSNHTTVPPQNLVHGRHRRHRRPLAFETAPDLAGAPCRMAITQRQDPIFDRTVGPQRGRMGTTRTIRKLPIGSKAAEPLVPNLGADPDRRHNSRRFAPSWFANRTNSRR